MRGTGIIVASAVALFAFALGVPAARAASRDPRPRSSSAPVTGGTFDVPWSVSSRAPVTRDVSVERRAPSPAVRRTNVPTLFLLGAVRFYQVGISPADGASCMLYPTCSGYARLALRKHGPVVGFVMTAERVMRNHTGAYYPTIWKFGRWRNYDPVEANDFWFPSEKRKARAAMAARARELETHP